MKKKYIQPTIKDHVLQTKNCLLNFSDETNNNGSINGQSTNEVVTPPSIDGYGDGTDCAKGNYFSDWD